MVAGCPKYIFGNFRNFLKNSEKNFSKFFNTTLFENFVPKCVSVAAAKNQSAQGLRTPQNRPWPKKSIFSKSEISIPQSNHGKRNIKLMLVRPKKHFRTTCRVPEIIAKIWIFALPVGVFCRNSCRNVQREGKNPNFCDYLRDAASSPKTFLGPN